MDFRAALFDLDGTLLDSGHVWQWVDEAFLSRRGLPVPPDYAHAISAMTNREAAQYTIARFGLEETPEDLMRTWQEMAGEAYARDVRLKPGAAEYLQRLHQEGVRLVVVTALHRGTAEGCLKNNGIHSLFERFYHMDEQRHNKRSPALYRQVAADLGLAPTECIFYDDLAPCLAAASEAGVATCGVYDAACPDAAATEAVADSYIRTFMSAM